METIGKLSLLITLSFSLLTSCEKDVTLSTNIDKDGTCSRELSFVTDSQFVTGGGFNEDYFHVVSVDDGWDLTWAFKGDEVRNAFPATPEQYSAMKNGNSSEEDIAVVYAKRNFASVEEMCSLPPFTFNGERLAVEGKLEKVFRWFYTDYLYTENVKGIASHFEVPVTEWMTEEEVSFWYTGSPDLCVGKTPAESFEYLEGLNEKHGNWLRAVVIYKLLGKIVDQYETIADAPVSKERFVEWMADRRMVVGHVLETNGAGNNALHIESLEKTLAFFFESDAYSAFFDKRIKKKDETLLQELLTESDARNIVDMAILQYTENVSMPGLVIDCGKGELNGDVVSYRITGHHLLPADYPVTVRSRVINVWAIALTAAVAFFLPLLSWWRRRR